MVHCPSPGAYPHALSTVSHTSDAQTAAAAAVEQVPVSAGEWWLTVGMPTPFAMRGTQVNDSVLHHCVATVQSESAPHPPAGTQIPPAMSHVPLEQSVFVVQATPFADAIGL